MVEVQEQYFDRKPDPRDRAERVSFGTSGHRGSSLRGTFNEAHVLAITQAICDYRTRERTAGPLFIGRDTHALSEPAFRTALEVLAANGVETMVDRNGGYTPTPAVSHAILTHNRHQTSSRADGIVTMESAGTLWNPVTADWREAQAWADRRCRGWGYAGAASYAGWQEACRQYDFHGRCVRTLVTRFYPCAG